MYKTIFFSNGKLPLPMSPEKEKSLYAKLDKKLKSGIKTTNSKEKNIKNLVCLIYDSYKDIGIKLKYIGPYSPDPKNPERTNPFVYGIGEGCSGIPIYHGVIGFVIRNFAETVYIPDVEALEKHNPKAHFSCDSTMKGSEVVIALPYTYHTGKHKGKKITRITLDIDIPIKNVHSDEGILNLEKICLPYLKKIFPGPPKYSPIEGIHITKDLVKSH